MEVVLGAAAACVTRRRPLKSRCRDDHYALAVYALPVLRRPPPRMQRFFCYGHLVAGPNWRASLGTAALIAAPAGVFLGLVAPYLMFHVQVVIMVFR